MNKKLVRAILVITSSVLLCGCADFPPVTEDQSEVISEYAASLLLKYDKENHSRLIDTSDFKNAYNKAWDNYNSQKKAYEDSIKAEEEKRKKEAAEQEAANSASKSNAVDIDATVVDRSEGGSGSGINAISSMPMGTFLDVDFDIDYTGYKFVSTYPEDGTDFFFSMDATKGKKLLVMTFDVTNISSSDAEFNMFDSGVTFKVNINDEGYLPVNKTMLEDDLSEYLSTFKGNETKEAVLIAEVSEDTDVESLILRMQDKNGNSINKRLVD